MNVLLLVADALRSDYLGCYGNEKINTSVVDTLAKEGVIFNQAIATATWTPPSTSAIISGIYPHKLGIYDFDTPLDPQIKTLFHYFSDNDYEVGSYVFDEKYLFSKFDFAKVQGNFRDFKKPLNWIKKNSDKNFFLYMHYYWTHGPYEPQNSAKSWSEANERILAMLRKGVDGVEKCKKLYKKAVEKMSEEWLAQILDVLEKENIIDDTLIVFTGDHGESWGERIKDKSKIRVNFDLHGHFLYDELLKVPLIFRMPKRIPKGIVIKKQVRNIDIMPTILNVAGIKHQKPIDGISLMGLFNRENKKELMAISSAPDVSHKTIIKRIAKISLRTPKWKLIWSLKENYEELYNLEDDSNETANIVTEFPEIAEKLKNLLKEELKYVSPENIPISEEEKIKNKIKQLKILKKI